MKLSNVAAAKKPSPRKSPIARDFEHFLGGLNVKGQFTIDGTHLIMKELALPDHQLTSLVNIPQTVNVIDVSHNHLHQLDGMMPPKESFYAHHNRLTTLLVDGKSPFNTSMAGSFNVSSNPLLDSLEGMPEKIGGDVYAATCFIRSLVGGPKKVFGDFTIATNHLTNLEGIPAVITGDANFFHNDIEEFGKIKGVIVTGVLNLRRNKLTSLQGIENCFSRVGLMMLTENPITSHILGLLKIEDLREIEMDDRELTKIVNKYLDRDTRTNQDVLDCQSELLDAGYDEFAKL